jgi:porphobilinogen synthase
MSSPSSFVNATELSSSLSRPRRLRRTAVLRDMVAETRVHASHLMQPYFVKEGHNDAEAIAAMPGVARLSIDKLQREIERAMNAGLRQVMLFGVTGPTGKDAHGSHAAHDDGLIPTAVRALKKTFGHQLLVATDVCLCGYTSHGHCGVLKDGHVDNDASLAPLAAMACAHARAGADMVAPSDMMDHRVGAMRRALDAMGAQDTALMSYSVKYASAYYGPFRDAAGSAPGQGDRKGYQMDPRNRREAHREALLDVAEGADMLMVKPALAYLDIIALLRANTTLPVACYNVSGEYSMVKAAAHQGYIDEAQVVQENFTAMRRAGADLIITYHATDALEGGWLTR